MCNSENWENSNSSIDSIVSPHGAGAAATNTGHSSIPTISATPSIGIKIQSWGCVDTKIKEREESSTQLS